MGKFKGWLSWHRAWGFPGWVVLLGWSVVWFVFFSWALGGPGSPWS